MLSHLCDQLWCNTNWLYRGQHGSQALLIHILTDMSASIGGGSDQGVNPRPSVWWAQCCVPLSHTRQAVPKYFYVLHCSDIVLHDLMYGFDSQFRASYRISSLATTIPSMWNDQNGHSLCIKLMKATPSVGASSASTVLEVWACTPTVFIIGIYKPCVIDFWLWNMLIGKRCIMGIHSLVTNPIHITIIKLIFTSQQHGLLWWKELLCS